MAKKCIFILQMSIDDFIGDSSMINGKDYNIPGLVMLPRNYHNYTFRVDDRDPSHIVALHSGDIFKHEINIDDLRENLPTCCELTIFVIVAMKGDKYHV